MYALCRIYNGFSGTLRADSHIIESAADAQCIMILPIETAFCFVIKKAGIAYNDPGIKEE